MRDVAIIGVGMTQVSEHWAVSLRELAQDALADALNDANVDKIDALYVGNAFSPTFSSQSQLGSLIADFAGLSGIEAYSFEAADASGGVALRAGYMAVASGLVDTVAVLGVEKSTDAIAGARVEARNVGLDADYESIHGATLPALAGLLMRRYMHEYNVELSAFEGFSINAHTNGKQNSKAMFRNQLRTGAFAKAGMVADPVNLFDGAPDGDGAACVILTSLESMDGVKNTPVVIAGSSVSTDTFKLQDRKDPLFFAGVQLSTQKAMQQAEVNTNQIDFAELHDSFTIVTTLCLEALGLAERGLGWKFASDIGVNDKFPISTFGGLKSRGNPIGATGIYQAVEATLQLRGQAGNNQVQDAKVGLIQNLGGLGSTVATHILRVL